MSHPTPTAESLRTASQRLVRTVDSLPDDAWRTPSLLPRWTAAHVVAHLTLNAEGLAGALVGVLERRPAPMYRSQEGRDADIEELAGAAVPELRERFLGSVTHVEAALAALPDDLAGTVVERTPGSGRTFVAGAVGWMRLREVEIHHADLGAGYSPADWPTEFAERLLDGFARGPHDGPGFRAVATDTGREWTFGTPGPTVAGPAAVLAWWGTGRPAYPGSAGPTSDDGVLPGIEGM